MQTMPSALFFGSIGTLADTSEMQRQSFNAAFRDAGLSWEWDRGVYRELLAAPGGVARIARYAERLGEKVDAKAVHALKVAHFEVRAAEGLELRSGVRNVITAAQACGVALGFVTTTGRRTVDLMFDGLRGQISPEEFAFVGHRDMVPEGKPSPDIYQLALSEVSVSPERAVAIEDTPESAQAALGADIPCVGFPGDAARDRSFPVGMLVVDRLTPAGLGLRAAA